MLVLPDTPEGPVGLGAKRMRTPAAYSIAQKIGLCSAFVHFLRRRREGTVNKL